MPYFRIDDAWWSHPKTLALTPAARDLWCRAGSYSMQHFTDGLISKQALTVLGAKPKLVTELVDVGYWEQVLVGYQFHDWHDHQETAEHLKQRRERARERMRTVRANRTGTEPERSGNVSEQVSIPSHPLLTQVSEESSVLETSRDSRTDEVGPSEVEFLERAMQRRVDFRKVRARVNEQAGDRVPNAIVATIIDRALDRAKPGSGDRTGLVLTSLSRDWAEWSQLVFTEVPA